MNNEATNVEDNAQTNLQTSQTSFVSNTRAVTEAAVGNLLNVIMATFKPATEDQCEKAISKQIVSRVSNVRRGGISTRGRGRGRD